MRTSRDARRRILLYFSLGIALPSGLLGYLALRGIRNDEALLDRERRERHTRIVQSAVVAVEQRLAVLAGSLPGPDSARDSADTLVRAVFRIDSSGRIGFLSPRLLYHEEEFTPSASTVDQSLLDAAQRAARRGRHREAAGLYDRLATRYALARTRSGLAVGPAARLEQAAVLAAGGDTLAAGQVLRDLYRRLLHGGLPLTRSEFAFFTGQVREAAAQYAIGSTELAALSVQDSAARRQTEELLAFAAAAGTTLPARLRGAGNSQVSWRSVVVESEGRTDYVLAHRDGDGWKALLLDPDRLALEVRHALTAHAGDSAAWVIRGPDRRVVASAVPAPAGPALVAQGFAGGFPPWTLELHAGEVSLLRGVFAPGRRVYLFAFVLIAGILLFGLTLTGRVVSRELELARMKSDFVATVSHEFRSPLTAIRQLAAMLGSGRVPSEERRQRYYDVLVQQSDRLSHLVENVLEAARLDDKPGTLRLEPVDVRRLVEEVTAAAQQRVAHEGFRVVAEVDGSLPPARLERETIARALGNLIDNAIKYSGASRQVLVRGFRDEARLVLSVQDWGAGLRGDELEKVFDRFYRGGDEMTRSVPGSGLGLTLVRKIVEAHGGEVRVESAPGQGSTFTMHLPLGHAA